MRQSRADAKANKSTGGLGKKAASAVKAKLNALSRQGAIDAVKMTKEEYEKTYPGRSYDADLDALAKPLTLDKNLEGVTGGDMEEPISRGDAAFLITASSNDILELVAARVRSPIARALAVQLRAQGFQVPRIMFVRDLPVLGRYRSSVADGGVSHIIQLRNTLDVGVPAGYDTLMHEIVHAATMAELIEPTTDAALQARKKLEALMNYAKAHLPNAYGFTDVYEFVSEAFTNPDFQRALESLPLPNQSRWNLWTAFKQLIMELLGSSNNVLKESLTSAIDLLSNEQFGLEGFFALSREMQLSRAMQSSDKNAGPPAANAPKRVPSTAMLGVKDGARAFIAYAKSKDPDTTYTLYPVTPAAYGGVKGAGIPGLTRAKVEEYMRAQGAEPIAPATDTTVKSGTPKNTSTKLVGYANNGDLQSLAFEQKDGTWTYYESDADVRADPDARVSKGLSKDQVQRYIANRGLSPNPPEPGAVKPNGTTPTQVGYDPVDGYFGKLRLQLQDMEAPLANIGGEVDLAATLRNTRVSNAMRKALRQYIEPAQRAGRDIVTRFGKTQAEIETLLGHMHTIERTKTKEQQFWRGNLPPVELKAKIQDLTKKRTAAEKYVQDTRNANPDYVQAVRQELAPKIKAMSDNNIDLAASYGLLSREAAEAIKKAYDYYVPMQTGERTTTGKAATGANVEVDRPFARMVEQVTRTIARGEQNRVRKAVLDLVQSSGLVNNKTKENPVHVGDSVKIRYNKERNALVEGVDSHVFDDNTIGVYVNGDRIPMTISDPALLEALHPFRGPQRETAITVLAAAMARINRIISIGKTSLNPAWAPFNFVRDALTANINMPLGVSRLKFNMELAKPQNYAKVFWNVAKEAFGKEPSGAYALAKDGMISHRMFIGGVDEVAHDTAAMFKPGLKDQTKNAVGKIFDVLSIWPQAFESLTRYAMYEAARKSGFSHERAAHAAKNASVNFEKRGASNLGAMWIFANAKVQGIHALKQTVERNPVLAGVGAAGIVALGAMAAAVGYDESEKDKDGKSKYVKIPNYKKDSLVLFAADGKGLPIPQEIAPFYAIGNAYQEAFMGGITPGEATSRVFTAFINNAWPGNVAQTEFAGHKADALDFLMRALVPSAASPMVDVWKNKNTFGSPVVSGLDDKLKRGIPKSEMGSPNENQLAVNAAKWLYKTTDGAVDIAPQQLKIVHNYFNPFTEGAAFTRDLLGLREPKYVGDVVNPFTRKFTGAATEFYDQDQFDELLAKSARAKYLAETRGIATLSPEEQALARSAATLAKVKSDADNLFKGTKLMTKERRDLLNERKREMILGGIRRYNEMRDRTVPKQ